jgi:PucR family transcriptional regulator, purine catabolism regulatory protein
VLTIGELVAQPGLGLEIVAGVGGAGRRVRWLSSTELVDPTPWLKGGELMLTTGLALHDEASCTRFAANLDGVGCAGIGFALGLGHNEVPAALREAADRCGLPIFTIPYEVPYVAVTEVAMTRLVNEQAAAHRRALDVHERLTALVLAERGLEAMLAEASKLTGFGLVLRDSAGHVLARAPGPDGAAGQATRLEVGSNGERGATLEVQGASAPLDEGALVLLGHVRTVLALELLKRQAVLETERRLAGDLIDELLDGSLPERELERQIRVFGLGERPLTFALVRGRGVAPDVLHRRTADALGETGRLGIAAPRDGGVCVLLEATSPADARTAAESLLDALDGDGSADLSCGVGEPRTRAGDLRRAYDEAVYALESRAAMPAPGSRVGTPADLGSLRLILALQDPRGVELFCDAVLGPLEAHDRASHSHLCRSLEAYIEANGRWADAAARLFVHRHTLRYRIGRIEELTGRDLANAQDRLEFWLALKAREVGARRPSAATAG